MTFALLFAGALAQAEAEASRIDELVQRLGHPDITTRDSAQDEMLRIGTPAREALERALGCDNPEVAARARFILGTVAPDAWAFPEPPSPAEDQTKQVIFLGAAIQDFQQAIRLDAQAQTVIRILTAEEAGRGEAPDAARLVEAWLLQGTGWEEAQRLMPSVQFLDFPMDEAPGTLEPVPVPPPSHDGALLREAEESLRQAHEALRVLDLQLLEPAAPPAPAPEAPPAPEPPREVPSTPSDVIWT